MVASIDSVRLVSFPFRFDAESLDQRVADEIGPFEQVCHGLRPKETGRSVLDAVYVVWNSVCLTNARITDKDKTIGHRDRVPSANDGFIAHCRVHDGGKHGRQ